MNWYVWGPVIYLAVCTLMWYALNLLIVRIENKPVRAREVAVNYVVCLIPIVNVIVLVVAVVAAAPKLPNPIVFDVPKPKDKAAKALLLLLLAVGMASAADLRDTNLTGTLPAKGISK